jgi:hypothetical protein
MWLGRTIREIRFKIVGQPEGCRLRLSCLFRKAHGERRDSGFVVDAKVRCAHAAATRSAGAGFRSGGDHDPVLSQSGIELSPVWSYSPRCIRSAAI